MSRLALCLLTLLLLTLAACGNADVAGQPSPSATGTAAPAADDAPVEAPAAGMCAEGVTDCVDTVVGDEPVEIDETGIAQARRDAEAILGAGEDAIAGVRIARRGDEEMMLTEDYVVGRITVELDDVDDDGTFEVTAATVELPDGPETFTLD